MNAIQQTAENTFKLTARGCDMTLVFERKSWNPEGEWVMYTVNAAVKVWNRGYATPKFFKTLADVEAKYKTWRGIAALAA